MNIPEDATIVEVDASHFEMTYDATHTFPFFEDENGDGVYGYGHQDKAEFVRQVNEYDTLCNGGEVDSTYTPGDVSHGYAVAFEPAGGDEEYWQFTRESVTAETPRAFPMTWLSR